MTDPRSTDRPVDCPSADAPQAPATPVVDTAPPLAPEQSPWWSAPSGKPFGIPDFSHEFAALLAWLVPAPQPVAVRATSRRRRS
jgi:hypothetical protein